MRLVGTTQKREGSSTPITVTVVGLTGEHVGDLMVTWDGPETVTNPPDNCAGTPTSSWACAASAAATLFRFGAQSNDAGTLTFTITVPEGADDRPVEQLGDHPGGGQHLTTVRSPVRDRVRM